MDEIIKSSEKENYVSNLKGHVSDDNQITLTWDWPENEEYNLCVVYRLEKPGETLSMLLERNAKKSVYSNDFGSCHKETIMDSFAQFRVYPAKRENKTLYIVDQKVNNISDEFHKKVRIEYRIEYERPRLFSFSNFRRARILVRGQEQMADGYICYRCLGGIKSNIVYGIDLASFGGRSGYEIVVGRDETIELFLEEEQKNHLELIQC